MTQEMQLHSILLTANSVVRIAVKIMILNGEEFFKTRFYHRYYQHPLSASMLALWCCDHGGARLDQTHVCGAQIL